MNIKQENLVVILHRWFRNW